MSPSFNLDPENETWQEILKAALEVGSVDRELLKEVAAETRTFREEWLISSAVTGEKFIGISKDIGDIRVDHKQLVADMNKVVSNHGQESKAFRQELMDSNMERHDCKADLELKIQASNAEVRNEIAKAHPTRKEMSTYFVIGLTVLTLSTSGMLWVFNNLQTKSNESSMAVQFKDFKTDIMKIVREIKK